MIAVTGASGKLGRLVIEGLLEKEPAASVVAVVRSPEKVQDLAARDVAVRRGDYSDPASLIAAFEGVERLLLISSNDFIKRAVHHRAVIDAASTVEVSSMAYTSVLKAEQTTISVLKDHKITEDILRASGIPYTFLRNGWYIENQTENLAAPLAHGAFFGAAQNGRISAASRSDYAAAAVKVLTEPGHDGKTYELAGEKGYTMPELAAAVSEWSNKSLPYKDLPPDAYKTALLGAGLPEPLANFLTEVDIAVSRGELEAETNDLPSLIGRSPRTLVELLADLPKP